MSRWHSVLLLNGNRAGEWLDVERTYFRIATISEARMDSAGMPVPHVESYRAVRLGLFNKVVWVGVLAGTPEDEMTQLAIRAVLKPDVVDKLKRAV